jgi:hypothetical protein
MTFLIYLQPIVLIDGQSVTHCPELLICSFLQQHINAIDNLIIIYDYFFLILNKRSFSELQPNYL